MLGRPDDPARPGLRRAGAVAAARLPRAHGARRRAGGRAAARVPVRPRLDAVHRPDAGRDPDPVDQRGHRRPRRAAARRSTPSASACRSSSPGWPTAGRSARSASSAATRPWVTRLGGADAGRWSASLLVTGWWDRGWSPGCRCTSSVGFETSVLMTCDRVDRSSAPTAPRTTAAPASSTSASCCAGPGASSPRCAPR